MSFRDEDANRSVVGIILAIGICTALNIIVMAVLWDAIHGKNPGLSENATQVLTGAFGGIIGILGGFLGYAAGKRDQSESKDDDE